jgi:hypothetical protein
MGSFNREEVNQKYEGIPASLSLFKPESDWMEF